LAVVLAGLVAAEALGTLALGKVARDLMATFASPGALPLDPVLGVAASALAWLILTWLAVTTGLAAVAQSAAGSGRRPRASVSAGRWSPLLARRAAALLLGAGLAGAVGPPSSALAEHRGTDRAAAQLPDWSADRPAATGAGPTGRVPRVSTTPRPNNATDHVVVRPGDTLWGIAARHLGPGADEADVAAAWPRWHAANRAVIGQRPDLILPGQVLRLPRA